MEKRDVFREYINGLAALDNLKGDVIAKNVEEALNVWIANITQNHPEGFVIDPDDFVIDPERFNLAVAMVKKSAEINQLVEESPFKAYISAIIAMEYRELSREAMRKKKKGKVDEYKLLMKFAFTIFILGYALRVIQNHKKTL